MKNIFKVHNLDSRLINKVVKDKVVDVTITSPPYFDMKDYDSELQIGYGQEYDEYLEDLKKVFKNVFDITKDDGTLWVVIDSYKRNGEVVPLPFDFSSKIKEVGWKLQEVIIWKKDRTLPWSNTGQMRSIFEYILVFSKSESFNFYIDRVRDFKSLKRWWVKYPERYNPKGKSPDSIWEFGIPVQGSWGSGYIDHFCPLPEGLIEQILKITTNETDIVLDCFSGSGAVLAKAESMNRKYIGFELNKEYIKMFKKYQKKTLKENKKDFLFSKKNTFEQEAFEKLIIDLRVLKYARLLYKNLSKNNGIKEIRISTTITRRKTTKKNALVVAEYNILNLTSESSITIQKLINEIIRKKPLSNFGIEPIFYISDNYESFLSRVKQKYVYIYTEKRSHKFSEKIEKGNFSGSPSTAIIISNIKVDLNEKDYE
ncbi:site-specific DNA-methyltransferase [uncultured Winogradskyella sp.]|uniref:DNA-methyltransferase n=1 Tax=uncultured Winogradskyella sp. TaxID=395353 RepID=UPI00262525E0|nr:site-specific DNA-methyltransferase [uncultured Winogradskyella sp.]